MRGIFFAVLAGAVACGGESKRVDVTTGGSSGTDPNATSGTGGSSVGASGGTTGCSELSAGYANCCSTDGAGNTRLLPSFTGWIDHADPCNDVGVQGSWHAYGDQYDSLETHARCITVGLHAPSECAQVTSPPPPPAWGFPNVNGELHTTGATEPLLACPAGFTLPGCPAEDFVNMSGAGIALDFNADVGPPDGDGVRDAWDPSAFGVIGVSFEIENPPPKALHIEFPMLLTASEAAAADPPVTGNNPTTDDEVYGAPYWGSQANGDAKFPASPVTAGQNVITWDQVASPRRDAGTFDPHRIIGIRFHVVAGKALAYDFTVKNFTFLRHL